jgi:ABC-type glycerol-3-phosphate transport system substrate-binding protein
MMRKLRGATLVAIGAGIALLAAGCSAGSSNSGDGKVTLTFWQNSTTGPGQAFWKSTIADFQKAHPNVTI